MTVNPTILVVDDFRTMRRTTRGALSRLGFQRIEEASDGFEALEVLKEKKIDLILCDWNMPNMNGLDLLKAAKNDENLKDIPFIMITAEGRKKKVLESIRCGVSNYLVKPFTADLLSEKITKALNREEDQICFGD